MTLREYAAEHPFLKPCPFCGEQDRLYVCCSDAEKVSVGVHFDEPCAIVLCGNCCAAAGFIKFGKKYKAKTRADARGVAMDYWNMREEVVRP